MERGASPRTAFGLPVDDTRRLGFEDYAEALAKIIDAAKKQGALAVYTYGAVSVPGISDLDVIIVSEAPVKLSLDQKTRWILGHTPEVLSPEEFKSLGERVDTRNLQRVWGEDLGVPEVPEGRKRALAANYAARRAIALHKALATRQLMARTLLRHLHALRYNFSLLGLEEPRFFKDVDTLRGLWFSLGPGRLVALLEMTLEALGVIEDFFSNFKRADAEPVRSGNWLWLEGEPQIPRPEPLPFRGKPAEVLYYLKLFRAKIPGEALGLLEPFEPPGWRNALCWLPTFFSRAK